MNDFKFIKLFLVVGMCFRVGIGLNTNNFISMSDSPQDFFPEETESPSNKLSDSILTVRDDSLFTNSVPCTYTDEGSFQDDCATDPGSFQTVDNLISNAIDEVSQDERQSQGGGDEISSGEVEPGEYHNTPGGDMSRHKRYPEHLDPTKHAFFPFWLRVGECPISSDGLRQHFCPTPTTTGKWVCIDDYQLCDGMKNCPNAEDESSTYCMFFKSLKSEVDLLTRTVSALSTATGIPPSAEGVEQYPPITATLRKYENVKFPLEKWIQ